EEAALTAVSRAHVAAQVVALGAGAGVMILGVDPTGLRRVALVVKQGTRDRVVIQTGDVPELERQVYGGLAVGRKESTVLRGVLVNTQDHMEGLLHVRHRSDQPQVHGIAGAADCFKTVCLGESNQGVPFFLAGAEPLGKLFRCEEMTELRAGRILHLGLKKILPPSFPPRAKKNKKTTTI